MALNTIPNKGLTNQGYPSDRIVTPLIINGDMSIAQRGTSSTGLTNGSGGFHTVDRFRYSEAGAPSSEITMTQDTNTNDQLQLNNLVKNYVSKTKLDGKQKELLNLITKVSLLTILTAIFAQGFNVTDEPKDAESDDVDFVASMLGEHKPAQTDTADAAYQDVFTGNAQLGASFDTMGSGHHTTQGLSSAVSSEGTNPELSVDKKDEN